MPTHSYPWQVKGSLSGLDIEILYNSALLYVQDRWLECDLEKNHFLDGFVGFGGGRYQCPGRYVVNTEHK